MPRIVNIINLKSFILIHIFIYNIFTSKANNLSVQCSTCRFLVKTFIEGMEKTEKLHFGGGNTDWEERKLGKFRTSETRFVEVMEYVCKTDDHSDPLSSMKDFRFKCQSFAEMHENTLEEWFFDYQDKLPNLEKYLCIDKLKLCCDQGYYGSECLPCPGVKNGAKPCFGHGTCDGDTSRLGTGDCTCLTGYVGKMCSNCDSNYFIVQQNSTFIECKECFDGCAGGCTGERPIDCKSCRSGYIMDEAEGCKDIDECLEPDRCKKNNEVCINLQGSFECKCADGYKHSAVGECEIDVEALPSIQWIRPVQMIRLIAYASLLMISIFVFSIHRSALTIFLTVITILTVVIIDFYFYKKGFKNLFT